jgi:type I restriction enzyme M protein
MSKGLAWVLFLKFLDEQEETFASEAEFRNEKYLYIIEGEYRWSNWVTKGLGKKKLNSDKRDTPEWEAETFMEFVKEKLIPYLASLSGSSEREVIAGIFDCMLKLLNN